MSEEVRKVKDSRNFLDNKTLWNYCLENSNKEGLFLEFGVWKGYSINYMSSFLPQKKFYGFDSFEGLPEFWRSGYDKGFFRLDEIPVVNNNVELVIGLFQKTLSSFLNTHSGTVDFCHVDCDLYSSAIYILKSLKKRFRSGTIIIFDEYYNYPGFKEGEMKAFVDFVFEEAIEYEYIGYNVNHEQVAVQIKKVNFYN